MAAASKAASGNGATAESAAIAAANAAAGAPTGALDTSAIPDGQTPPPGPNTGDPMNLASGAPGSTSAAGSGAAFAQALGLPDAASATTAQTGAAAAVKDPGASPGTGRATASPGAAAAAKVRTGAAAVPVKTDGKSATAANTAPASGAGAADDGAASTVSDAALTDGGATAQTAASAAISAAAGAVAPSVAAPTESSSWSADDSAAPAVGAAAQQAGGPSGPIVGAASADPKIAATAAADKVPLNTQAAMALANVGGPDKHARGASADSSLSAASGGPADASQLGINAPSTSDIPPTPSLKVAAGVDTPEFGAGVADRVSWMVDNNLNGAKLQVNPAQLGPIEVRIAVQGDHAQVWLTSHSAVTRDALESSSPKLREMLGAQGFGQVSVDISQRSFQERPPQAQSYDWTPSANRGAATAAVSPTSAALSRPSRGAVDAYA